MSATTAPGLGHALDISSTSPTPFSRLVRVELRKTWDTRAGLLAADLDRGPHRRR